MNPGVAGHTWSAVPTLFYKVKLSRVCIFVEKKAFLIFWRHGNVEGPIPQGYKVLTLLLRTEKPLLRRPERFPGTHRTPSLCRHTQIWQRRAGTSHWLHRSQRAERHTSHPGREKQERKQTLRWHRREYFVANLF